MKSAYSSGFPASTYSSFTLSSAASASGGGVLGQQGFVLPDRFRIVIEVIVGQREFQVSLGFEAVVAPLFDHIVEETDRFTVPLVRHIGIGNLHIRIGHQ